jgi:hypothetical protein
VFLIASAQSPSMCIISGLRVHNLLKFPQSIALTVYFFRVYLRQPVDHSISSLFLHSPPFFLLQHHTFQLFTASMLLSSHSMIYCQLIHESSRARPCCVLLLLLRQIFLTFQSNFRPPFCLLWSDQDSRQTRRNIIEYSYPFILSSHLGVSVFLDNFQHPN